ncbi:beta-mannosidase [Anaerosporobacter sp.]|uniref:beta-mannosidase n=1 Tax=Anaerosporobacter sp. TaxID=1872529 RepID=UPI00286EC1B7|nr:glycoside hydrolase family 2 protein [Anaerosporobacter sp.]
MGQHMIELNGEWLLSRADGKTFETNKEISCDVTECNVQIPGSVLSGLMGNQLLDNPYYRTNEYFTREMLREDFVFSRSFSMHKEEGKVYELMCDGIDTIADIYLNDTLLKAVDNMHVRYQIACTDMLVDGENTIRIHIYSPITYIENHVPEQGKEIHFVSSGTMKANQYIRKAHSMFGWDWGPQLPDMGIWRDIYIRGFEVATLEDVRFKQKHENGMVYLQADAEVKLDSGERVKLEKALELYSDLSMEYTLTTPDGDTVCLDCNTCTIEQPQLWWPNRYGKQPLYTVKAVLKKDGSILNEKVYRIGLRTLTVSREKDCYGEEFALCINGVKIFTKGANYIPEDCVYSFITPERTRYIIDSSAEAGFNCLRVWGGGYYPSDEFYTMCDEKGLIVWQDFMYACNVYELTDELKQSIIEETRDNVRRLRHHACLGLWCGNNEQESAWVNWGEFRDHSDALKQDYLTMFEELIPQTLREEDEETFYWPSSPSSGGGFDKPDSDDIGDRHYWEVWHGEKPFTDYENYFFRFCSEFGFQSFPCMETIETFTVAEDRNIFSEVMESHQKNDSANAKILRYISDNFLYPKDFASLTYVSQVLQGIAIKAGVEHWRRNRGRCMGTIYWQLNDIWPVASWASIDYYGRWKALHYMARHFYADILGSLKVEGTRFIPYVQNETLIDATSNVTLYVKDMDCNIVYEWSNDIETKALTVEHIAGIDVAEFVNGKEKDLFIEARFTNSDGTSSSQVEVLKPYKHMNLKNASVNVKTERMENTLQITLQSNVFAAFTEITVHGVRVILSDNFFHITDTKEHVITAELPVDYVGIPEVTVCSLCNSYCF